MQSFVVLGLIALAALLAFLLARSRKEAATSRRDLALVRARYESIIDLEEERHRIAAERHELRSEGLKEVRGRQNQGHPKQVGAGAGPTLILVER